MASLKEYARKRSFDKTPEPGPAAGPKSQPGKLQFCVQRHHASHLHYDLRLEVDGVLKSWAVPKGPTLDPDQKRLAMMVEDHPIEYGGFEGVIPEGNYGAGSVMLWDRGVYDVLGDLPPDRQLQRGDFKFRLHGEKLSGEFALVRMQRRGSSSKGNEWLLIKKRDASAQPGWDPEDHAESVLTGRTQEEIARQLKPRRRGTRAKKSAPKEEDPAARSNRSSRAKAPGGRSKAAGRAPAGVDFPAAARRAPMPPFIAPMLAVLGKGDPPGESPDWVYEIKWDGVRALCFIDGGKVRLISRNGNAMDRQYPELSVLPHHVRARQAILDGEIAVLDDQGRPSFELLQQRINVAAASSIAKLARAHPVVLYVFDLLYLDGHDLRQASFIERKRLLREILETDDMIRYSEHFAVSGREMLDAVERQGLEGIVGKRVASKYESRRSPDWVKWKVENSAEFVICGFTEGEGPRRNARKAFGALVLGIYDKGKLHWAGNVGTGFDRKMLELVYDRLQTLVTSHSPLAHERGLPRNVTWTRPELVCEVKFANWTEEGRLRAPVFLGLRPDKNPSECVRDQGAADPGARSPLFDETARETTLTLDGHRIKFTNLGKIFYPKDGYTKRDLLNYYGAVAPLLLPHLKDRPLSLKRYPNGIDKPYFFQKNTPENYPKWLRTVAANGIRYIVADDRATLLYVVNLGCIDHNPWMSRAGSLDCPDYVLIDLDPYECGYDKIIEAALWVRKHLDRVELESFPKTTGGDGMHVYIPIAPVYSYATARSFAEALAALAAAERPDLFTAPRIVAQREKGKVYFDWQQIAQSKTIAAPYSVRAHPGAPVSTPLKWSEVTPRLRPGQFTLGNAMARFDRVGDLFEGVLTRPQRLEPAVEKLAKSA
jgi:bifunctional non-homologous end joining protein LigD